jgi:hypothetical protein
MASAASGITPAADLIAEAPEAHRPAAADRADGGEATPSSVAVRHRRHLDHETSVRYPHLERGVVQITRGPAQILSGGDPGRPGIDQRGSRRFLMRSRACSRSVLGCSSSLVVIRAKVPTERADHIGAIRWR